MEEAAGPSFCPLLLRERADAEGGRVSGMPHTETRPILTQDALRAQTLGMPDLNIAGAGVAIEHGYRRIEVAAQRPPMHAIAK